MASERGQTMTTDGMSAAETGFTRSDNAVIMEFVSSAAGALAAANQISQKDLDSVRVALSGIQSDAEMRELPLLLCLTEQNAEIIKLLCLRYGTDRLALNLLRCALRGLLTDTLTIFGKWGQDLLEKAELMFNRPFIVMGTDHQPVRRVLYSQVIVDLAGVIAAACDEIKNVRNELAYIYPADFAAITAADLQVDTSLAESLGMTGVRLVADPFTDEVSLKERVATVFTKVADYTADVFNQIASNTDAAANTQALMAVEGLRADAHRLKGLKLAVGGTLNAWEARRISIASSLYMVNHAATGLAKASTAAIGKGNTLNPALCWQVPANINRRVVADLIAAGVPVGKAEQAVNAFNVYCRDRNIGAKDILQGELTKISPHLLPRSLELFQTLNTDNTVASAAISTEDKRHTLERSQSLRKGFADTLAGLAMNLLTIFATSTLLITVATSFTACGIKTAPKSDVVDFRPDIPFRNK